MINLNKKQTIIVIAVGAVILLVIGYYIYSNTEENNYEQLETISEEPTEQTNENVENEEEIVVHIAGEVKNPGIVRIKQGARIADIIEQAGGLNEEADITNVNLAYIVEDGQKIVIPSKKTQNTQEINSEGNEEEIIQQNSGNTEGEVINTKTININKANTEELQELQGIGEATALKIIEYRKQNGNFEQIEDLKNVPGIGDAKFNAIKEKIKVK